LTADAGNRFNQQGKKQNTVQLAFSKNSGWKANRKKSPLYLHETNPNALDFSAAGS